MKACIQKWLIVAVLCAALMLLAAPVSRSGLAQTPYQTPTPLPDGRIIYVVQPGDNCTRISLLTGVKIEELRLLNNLDSACVVRAGQELLIGRVTQQQPTPSGPTSTPTPLLPSMGNSGTAQVCVVLFDDANGNTLRERDEKVLAGGAVSITDRMGKTNLTGSTSAGENPLCFKDVPEGDYNVSMAIPQGYNPTMSLNVPLKLQAGDVTILNFGCQVSSKAVTPSPAAESSSPLLAVIGGILILSGIGLAGYLFLLKR